LNAEGDEVVPAPTLRQFCPHQSQNKMTLTMKMNLMSLMLKATRMTICYPFQMEYLKIKNKGLRPLKSQYRNEGNNYQQEHKVEEKSSVHAEPSVMNGQTMQASTQEERRYD
jgi:hypothetical protein